jgi:hypothetical protein
LICLKFVCVEPFAIVSGLYFQGEAALFFASTKGYVEMVKLLLALPGIDYNHEDYRV